MNRDNNPKEIYNIKKRLEEVRRNKLDKLIDNGLNISNSSNLKFDLIEGNTKELFKRVMIYKPSAIEKLLKDIENHKN